MRERKYLMNYKVGYLTLSVGVVATIHNEDKHIRFKQRNFGKWSCIGNQGRHLHDREKLRFLRRGLLYFPEGTESFNPVMIQIILSADVHPHPGLNSKQKRNSRPQQDPKENHSTACAISQHVNSKLKVFLELRSRKTVLFSWNR